MKKNNFYQDKVHILLFFKNRNITGKEPNILNNFSTTYVEAEMKL
jgi:hypothetical protein